MKEKLTGKLVKIYGESENAKRGTVELSNGRTLQDLWIPNSQLSPDGTLSDWILKQKMEEASIEGFVDRFGRFVTADVARRIHWIGGELEDLGFRESKKKQHLYYLRIHKNDKIGDVTVFADMRGSEVVPIFDETCPMIYCSFDRSFRLESLERNEWSFKLHNEEKLVWSEWNGYGISPRETDEYFSYLVMHILDLRGIPSRRTYDVASVQADDFEEYVGTLAEKESVAMREYNSYFSKFMKQVEEFSPKRLWKKCRLCGVDGISKHSSPSSVLEWYENEGKLEMHHVSYIPEVVIPVCKKCHVKIHHSGEYEHLKPEMSRQEWIENRRGN